MWVLIFTTQKDYKLLIFKIYKILRKYPLNVYESKNKRLNVVQKPLPADNLIQCKKKILQHYFF